MQKQDLKNLLENIYHLLAEEAPLPTAEAPPIKGGVLPWIPPYGLPTVPMAPQPPIPPLPPRGPRPPVPSCDGIQDCWYKWTDTLHWEWDIYQRKWVLRGLGDDGAGGYWRPVQMPENFQWQGGPYQGPGSFELFLRGLGILRGNNHTISGLD